MNITLLSLSLCSLYQISPILTGHYTKIKFSNFKHFSQTIFFNPKSLELANSKFFSGLGSILVSRTLNQNNLIDVKEVHDIYYNSTNFKRITNTGEKLIIIRDCIFDHVSSKDHPFIEINSGPTTYITDCLFNSCATEKGLIKLSSNAITISHICCSDLQFIGTDTNDALFITADPPSNSFCQIVFSTLFGNEKNEVKKRHVISLGAAAIRFQCINMSNFNQNNGNDDEFLYIHSPSCINMLMNSFCEINSGSILFFDLQDGDKQYAHYVGTNNFFYDAFSIAAVKFRMNANTQIRFENCYFLNNQETSFSANDGNGNKISIINCYFNKQASFSNGMNVENIHTYNDFTPFPLAYLNTAGICKAKKVGNAYGCNNGSCPGTLGCAKDAFDFKPGDFTYTLKHHDDIDTPTPTPSSYFSQSLEFSESVKFTKSKSFVETSKFTNSFKFSESNKFTKSKNFVETSKFTQSKKFSSSIKFTKSLTFLASSGFTQSSKFSASLNLGRTKPFSRSSKFTCSNSFEQSSVFSQSSVLPLIPVDGGNSDNKSKTAVIAGIATGASAAVAAAGIAAFFLIRRPKIPEVGDLDTIADVDNVVNNANPLYNQNAEEDPFKDDFVNN